MEKIKEILLCKYGEIVLKGANRRFFEDKLCKELRFRAQKFGKFSVKPSQSVIMVEPLDDDADIDGMFDAASKVFGIAAISRCAVAEKNMESIAKTAKLVGYSDRFSFSKAFKAFFGKTPVGFL